MRVSLVINPPINHFLGRTESFQYNAALAMMRAIRGFFHEKLHQVLGLEHLHQRRLMTRLCFIKFFQLNNKLIFMTYFRKCKNLPDIQIHLKPLVEPNT